MLGLDAGHAHVAGERLSGDDRGDRLLEPQHPEERLGPLDVPHDDGDMIEMLEHGILPGGFLVQRPRAGARGAERCTLLCRAMPRRCNSVSCGMARCLRPTPITAARYAALLRFKIQRTQSWSRKQDVGRKTAPQIPSSDCSLMNCAPLLTP